MGSTAGVLPAEAYDYWADVARTNLLGGIRGEPFSRDNFYADLQTGTLGDVTLKAWRSAPGITRGKGTDDLILTVPSSRSVVEIAGRRFEVNRSTVYLFDCRTPS